MKKKEEGRKEVGLLAITHLTVVYLLKSYQFLEYDIFIMISVFYLSNSTDMLMVLLTYRDRKCCWKFLYYWINTVWVWSSSVYTAGFDFLNTLFQTASTFTNKQVRRLLAAGQCSGTGDGQGWSKGPAPAAAFCSAFCCLHTVPAGLWFLAYF